MFVSFVFVFVFVLNCFVFYKQKTAYEMRISDWSSDVCSSDLVAGAVHRRACVGLGQDQRVDRARLRHVVRRERLEQARLAYLLRAQQPQAAAFDRAQDFLLALLLHLVLAVAEQGEVVFGGPAQELLRLASAGLDRKSTRLNSSH